MKVMYSTKEGSQCADCGATIKVGDPIAYYGPGRVYGLECHESELAAKHLAKLKAEKPSGPVPLQATGGVEWCVRISAKKGHEEWKPPTWLNKFRLIEWRGEFHIVRAPRSMGVVPTEHWAKTSAEWFRLHFQATTAEAVPYWVEED